MSETELAALKDLLSSSGYRAFLRILEANAIQVSEVILTATSETDDVVFARGKLAGFVDVHTMIARILPKLEEFYARQRATEQRQHSGNDNSRFWGSPNFH